MPRRRRHTIHTALQHSTQMAASTPEQAQVDLVETPSLAVALEDLAGSEVHRVPEDSKVASRT